MNTRHTNRIEKTITLPVIPPRGGNMPTGIRFRIRTAHTTRHYPDYTEDRDFSRAHRTQAELVVSIFLQRLT